MATTGNRQTKKKNNALFPDFPHGNPISTNNGNLTSRWFNALSSLFQSLQKYFKPEGILIPILTADEINSIEAQYTNLIGSPLPAGENDISGQTVFDSTNRVPKIFVITYSAGTKNIATASWKTFTIT